MTGNVIWAWIALVLGLSWVIMFRKSMKMHARGEADPALVVGNVILLICFWCVSQALSVSTILSQ